MYQSSSVKSVFSSSVAPEPAANFCAAAWNGKSSTACASFVVVKRDVYGREVSKTSPNMKNSRLPCRWA